ncbi:MAG: DnaB-like helicase C-terminal domain-containing protein [Acidimicrobiales bacterium]
MVDIDLATQRPQSVATLLWEVHQGVGGALGMPPVASGFDPLDDVLDGGFIAGDVVLLGGQPGSGKTICSLQWARNIAAQGRSVAVACFEHDEGALLSRLLVQELALLDVDVESTERLRARRVVRDLLLGVVSASDAVAASPLISRAFESMGSFSARVQLLRASTRHTTSAALEDLVAANLDEGGVLVVDYLQKLPVASAPSLDERVYRAIEDLKELAVAHRITVVALSAASVDGIGVDRLQLRHLRGADAVAHECDVAILLNDKVTAVADRHLKYDLTQLDDARRRSVFSVEKNRRGEVDIHLEFVKDFANFRFIPRGAFLTEAMRDD